MDNLSTNYIALELSKQMREIKSILDFCSYHRFEPLRFYCKNCKEEVCSLCLISHSGHFLIKQEFSSELNREYHKREELGDKTRDF